MLNSPEVPMFSSDGSGAAAEHPAWRGWDVQRGWKANGMELPCNRSKNRRFFRITCIYIYTVHIYIYNIIIYIYMYTHHIQWLYKDQKYHLDLAKKNGDWMAQHPVLVLDLVNLRCFYRRIPSTPRVSPGWIRSMKHCHFRHLGGMYLSHVEVTSWGHFI